MSNGIRLKNRRLLDRLHQRFAGLFTAAEAAEVLEVPVPAAATLVKGLCARGWLVRPKRGAYAVVPLGAVQPKDWRIDVWVVAAKLYAPCYVGGWSAAEHWSLTEQLFRSTVVCTGRALRRSDVEVQEAPLRLKHVPQDRFFGLKTVWRERIAVKVSDPSRTLADMLDDPSIGGGTRHVAEMCETYFRSEHRDERLLLDYLGRISNGAAYKRLGFLIETLRIVAPAVQTACLAGVSAGLSKLDPNVAANGVIRRRWNLRVNVDLANVGGRA